jgi:hypothetical protein
MSQAFFARSFFLVGGQEAGVALVELEEEGDAFGASFFQVFLLTLRA